MAYNTKYRVSFKDHYGSDIQADIEQDGWPVSSVTDVAPSGNPLVIEWPGERDDIFAPVRGGLATLSFMASAVSQFDEFFNAKTKEYRLRIYKDAAEYWRGWLTLSDYQEALRYPPYTVTVKAYDLGYLQHLKWDGQYHNDDTILDVIYRIIGSSSLELGVKERVNIYEDSIASTASDSMLDLINIHPTAFLDDSWIGITQYEVLSRLLTIFNAFIVQENLAFNICRVPDMRVSHNQRTFGFPQLLTSSGAEDLTSNLSNYKQMNRSAVLMACPNYRKLNMTHDLGLKNLVNNHNCNTSMTADDYWNKTGGSIGYVSGTTSPFPTVSYNRGSFLRLNTQSGAVITHERTYNVSSATRFDVAYKYEIRGNSASGTATSVKITVKIDDGGTPYYLNIATGAWSTTSSVDTLSFSATANRSISQVSFTTSGASISGTMTISMTSANWSGFLGYTFFNLSILPAFVGNSWNLSTRNLSETIDADSLEEYDQTFYFGDPKDTQSRDILAGGLTIAADGTATDSWQSNAGSTADSLLDLAVDCYHAQYETAARRLQCNLKGSSLDYLTVLKDSSDRCYLASSISKDMRKAELDGEWIEIKVGWGDNILVDGIDFTNGDGGAEQFDIYYESGAPSIWLVKTQTTTIATVTIEEYSVSGVRYLISITINDINNSDYPVFIWGGDTTQLANGDNEYEVLATIADKGYLQFSDPAEICNFRIDFSIQQAYGL